jgi:alpha-glucosidase
MTDPAVAYAPGQGYEPYDLGTQLDLWLKNPNGSASLGVVWPGTFQPICRRKKTLNIFYTGVTVYPGKSVLYGDMFIL